MRRVLGSAEEKKEEKEIQSNFFEHKKRPPFPLPTLTLLNADHVEVVGTDVKEGEEEDGPGNGLVEGDVLVQRHDTADEGVPDQGDEIPAHRHQDDPAIKI